jgi:hypothetical protein
LKWWEREKRRRKGRKKKNRSNAIQRDALQKGVFIIYIDLGLDL